MAAIALAVCRYIELAVVAHTAPVAINPMAADLDGGPGPEIAYALANGTVVVLFVGAAGPRSAP